MRRISCTSVKCGTVVSEDNDFAMRIRLSEVDDLVVEPGEISFVCSSMALYILVLDVVEVIE